MSVVTATLFSLALISTAPVPTPTPRAAARPSSQPGCVTPDVTGTFRITATPTTEQHGMPAVLMLENIEGCLEVTFITTDKGPATIDHLSQSGTLLKGRLNVTGSAADVTLRFNGATVAGSIMQGKHEWRVAGRKTS